MGDYVVQALGPRATSTAGRTRVDAAFLYPGQVLPPTSPETCVAAHARQHEEEDEWDALLSWFGLSGGDDERDALPRSNARGFPIRTR